MRTLLLAALMASAAVPALATSIERVTATPANDDSSILRISCSDCQQLPPRKPSYQVPELSGVASMAIVDQNGKPEVVRVDKFMGGSPVMTMSKTQAPLIEEMAAIETKTREAKEFARKAELQAIDTKTAAILPPDERGSGAVANIDRESTTAALSAQAAAFDPNSLTLRLR